MAGIVWEGLSGRNGKWIASKKIRFITTMEMI